MAQFTEDEKIMRRLEQRFNKGVVKYRLIEDGDKILIGLSGGRILWLCWSYWQGVHVF